jgi:ubiquinone/menaquinone biosynthesis C-methylase UbiE
MTTTAPHNWQQPFESNSSLSSAEIQRLLQQDRQLSSLLDDARLLALNFSQIRRVLDVGCGVGGWAYRMATNYPSMHILGIDKNPYLIAQAQAFHRAGNLTYIVQDMHHLEAAPFTPGAFDLVHMRFLVGDVSFQQFAPLLQSLAHLCQIGGLLIWSEAELVATNSPACDLLQSMILRALQVAGRSFSSGYTLTLGIVNAMSKWLYEAHFDIVRDKDYLLDVSAQTQQHSRFVSLACALALQIQPFLLETGVTTPATFENLLTTLRQELQAPTFCGICPIHTLVGIKREEKANL